MTEALKPCPFCGGKPIQYYDGDYVVHCSSANQCGVHPWADGYTSSEAITAWNTRYNGGDNDRSK